MQLEPKQPQSAAVVVAAALVLIVIRVGVSSSLVNDALAPIGQVGAWLRYDRPLASSDAEPQPQLQIENSRLREQLELPDRVMTTSSEDDEASVSAPTTAPNAAEESSSISESSSTSSASTRKWKLYSPLLLEVAYIIVLAR